MRVPCRDENGHTPLHLACIVGSPTLAATLISAGANLDAREGVALGGATPIMLALQLKHYDVAELVAAAGANVNVRNTLDGTTALHEACRAGDALAVKMLLSYGADTGARDARGNNASYHATVSGARHILLIAGMPPAVTPAAEEVAAAMTLRREQYSVLMGPAAKTKGGAKKAVKKKK
ncbi:MAG: ankyrin repeat domain-containing protein [Methanobacteriota archaeon]|nr:MAG: ankyrin repeat domain-containing protein [Euryarchaeota archaeon]